MKRLSYFFALLVLTFISNGVYAQLTSSQIVAEWQRAKAYTKEYLDAMPAADYGFKPTPEIRSFAEQMLHLTDGNYYFSSSISGKVSPLGKESAEKTVAQTKEATTNAVMASYDFIINIIQDMTPAQLQEKVNMQGHDITKTVALLKAFEHQTHHRGQTTIYLRLKGIKPPAEKLF